MPVKFYLLGLLRILVISACVALALFQVATLQPAAAATDWTYTESNKSDETFAVQAIKSGNRTMGCGASERQTKPFLFLNIMFNGYGTLTFIAPDFGVAPTGDNADFRLRIAARETAMRAVADGNVITFDMTPSQIASARRKGLHINEQAIDPSRFDGLRKVVMDCLGRRKKR